MATELRFYCVSIYITDRAYGCEGVYDALIDEGNYPTPRPHCE